MHPKKAYVLLYFCGSSVFFLVTGIVLLCLWEAVYYYILRSNMILKPNSMAYNIWIKNPVPISLKLYMFNWTNPQDIYNSSVKPKFQQMGPYYFSETKEKSSMVWNNNGTVSFKHLKTWYFEPSLSNGSLTDTVTSVDPVALSAVYAVRNWNYFLKKGMAILTILNSVVGRHSVGQMLFDGYEDPLLQSASQFRFLHSSMPKMGKFGWFYGRNGSEEFEGAFNMDTGEKGTLGQLYEWKYSNRTPYNPGSCGALENTSAGEFFPTNLSKQSIIKFFSPDLCRHVELEFEKEVVVKGILGYKYSAGDRFLDNGTRFPENRCFCDGNCMPYGALNISACRFGSPAFVSLPHFYKADPYYTQMLDGLEPDPRKHDFYMTFEPKTAVPLQVSARLQLNLRMQPVSAFRAYEDLPTLYFPVLWFEQVITIPDDMTYKIKFFVNFKVICCAISILLITIGLLIQLCMWYKICSIRLFGGGKSRKTESDKTIAHESVPLKCTST